MLEVKVKQAVLIFFKGAKRLYRETSTLNEVPMKESFSQYSLSSLRNAQNNNVTNQEIVTANHLYLNDAKKFYTERLHSENAVIREYAVSALKIIAGDKP